MSVITEIIPLDGIDLDGTPPCMTMTGRSIATARVCRERSAFRIITTCGSCGDKQVIFICVSCREGASAGKGACMCCGSRRGIDGYC